jgi:hypothetical protein
MSAHRAPPGRRPDQAGLAPVDPGPAGLAPVDPESAGLALVDPGVVEPGLVERHRGELARDARVERRLTWLELGCLLFVTAFVVLRSRYLT